MIKAKMGKNIKKRSASESETIDKKINISNKNLKKKKTVHETIQNGQLNEQVKKNVPKKFKNEKKNNELRIVQNSNKKEINENSAQKSKRQTSILLEKRQAFREKRAKNRHLIGLHLSIEQIKKKIELIENRKEYSRSAKRKLAVLRKRLLTQGEDVSKRQVETGKNKKPLEIVKKAKTQSTEQNKNLQRKVGAKINRDNKKKDVKQNKVLLKEKRRNEKDDDDDDDNVDDKNKNIEMNDELSEDDDESYVEKDNDNDNDNDNDDDDDDDDDDEEDEDEDEDEDDDDDEEEEEEEEREKDEDDVDDENENNNQDKNSKIKNKNVQKEKEAPTNEEKESKKKRYVLFVGNLSYSTTNEELKKHFLTKVSKIIDIRIPMRKDTNTGRGFAYVELANSIDYEKALSLNHSFLNERRINVQYSGVNKRVGVAKNFKLHALQKGGKLAGGKNNNKQNNAGNKGRQNTIKKA